MSSGWIEPVSLAVHVLMKSFRQLVQQVNASRATHLLSDLSTRITAWVSNVAQPDAENAATNRVGGTASNGHGRRLPPRRKTTRAPRLASQVVFVLAAVTLTSAIGYRHYNEPQLAVGKVSPRTLRAPQSASVVDSETTERRRSDARLGAVQVLMLDEGVNQKIYQTIQRYLDEGDRLRTQAGTFPFTATGVLSTATQRYLRQASAEEWEDVLAQVEGDRTVESSERSSSSRMQSSKELAVLELQNYRSSRVSDEDYTALRQLILRMRRNYEGAIAAVTQAAAPDSPQLFTADLLHLTDTEWTEVKVHTRRVLERMLAQGISPGLPETLLSDAVRMQIASNVPPRAESHVRQLLLASLEPNLVPDPLQTRLQAEQVARAVEPIQVSVRRGEVIIEAGRSITQREFVLLDHFGLSQRQINWPGLVGFAVLVSGGMVTFLLVERQFHAGLRCRDYVLVTLLTLTTPLLMIVGISVTSLPAVGLLVSSFYGSALGVTVVSLLSLALPMGMDIGVRQLAASSIASLLGAVMAGRLRSREELALLGGAVGLAQAATYLLVSLIITPWTPSVLYAILSSSAVQGLMGVVWSITALGISPYLEQFFDLVTPIRLAELSNPNRSLLKRLASETPGTFQHTLFVSTLAEAAARKLGCNVELVRAGTLYHDIGKMHDPLGFIENQMGGINKHDVLDDPWKSAEIIRKHVTEGLVMARKYRLPKAIRAFIPEHQGTMFITYFHHQAQQRAQQNPTLTVVDADFRYRGPIPQSRETGIVMVADSCEAALRSLKDATPQEALAMVNRILRARWQDQQLVESGLHRHEMPIIAEVFVKVWQDYNHQRIAYPRVASTSPRASITEPLAKR